MVYFFDLLDFTFKGHGNNSCKYTDDIELIS